LGYPIATWADSHLGLQRLGRSSGSRVEIWGEAVSIWKDNIFGIGVGQFTYLDGTSGYQLETHNDYISVLVELGILGITSLIALYVAIFMAGSFRTRAMAIFLASSSLFHNVLNYRHIWIGLALCIVLDSRDGLRQGHRKNEELRNQPKELTR
jgi:hypothetical protein